MKNFSIVRNIPFVDTKGWGFYFQKAGRTVWIEVPFLAVSFRLGK